jgi:hypothetical protein
MERLNGSTDFVIFFAYRYSYRSVFILVFENALCLMLSHTIPLLVHMHLVPVHHVLHNIHLGPYTCFMGSPQIV